jgi:hypothetical protein
MRQLTTWVTPAARQASTSPASGRAPIAMRSSPIQEKPRRARFGR